MHLLALREYKERNYQTLKTNNMRTKFANLLTSALLIGAVMCCFSSCDSKIKEESIDKNDLNSILKHCKGHVIVVAKGYNSGNFEPYRHYMILRDDSLNCFEYVGADYKLSVGDSLK